MSVFKHYPKLHKFEPLSRSEAVEYFHDGYSPFVVNFQQAQNWHPWHPWHLAREPTFNKLFPVSPTTRSPHSTHPYRQIDGYGNQRRTVATKHYRSVLLVAITVIVMGVLTYSK